MRLPLFRSAPKLNGVALDELKPARSSGAQSSFDVVSRESCYQNEYIMTT